jgi:hypothetical protein
MMNFNLNTKFGNRTGSGSCVQFTNTSPAPVPFIYSVYSVTHPIRGGLYLVIIGMNFRQYSVVQIANLLLPVIFYSSESVMVHIHESLYSGIYTVQMFNEYYSSNIVNYTI